MLCHIAIVASRRLTMEWTSAARFLQSCVALIRSDPVSPVHIRSFVIPRYSRPSATLPSPNKTCRQTPNVASLCVQSDVIFVNGYVSTVHF